MKPNDKAYQAARAAILKAMAERNCIIKGVPFNENNVDEFDSGEAIEHAKVALDAAYAAQFQSEKYAGLIKQLRQNSLFTDSVNEELLFLSAADAIEAVLAERDAAIEKRDALAKERDALAARLAPVDDDALVEIAVTAIHKEAERGPVFGGNLIPAAIAAIRPHIEAAERERCEKAVETVGEKINVAHHERSEWEDGYLQGVYDAAAAIRSGK